MILSQNFKDIKTAEDAFKRVQAEIDALPSDDLSAFNVDLVSAASIVLGVADRVLAFRPRLSAMPEFNAKSMDSLIDYALAAWYLHLSNLPANEPADAELLIAEMQQLRAKLLLWATPLAVSGNFEQAAIDQIREGAGQKDAASDLVALVGLYRSRWATIENICGVTDADLARGAELGPIAFALVSRRENKGLSIPSDVSLRIRKAWTLLDRAYTQCRRAIHYLRFLEDDVDQIAPNLRRNNGRPSSSGTTAAANTSGGGTGASVSNTQPAVNPGLGVTPGLGGSTTPFTANVG
jgi:hypothetical protein